ncbi:MAG: acyl-CoA thioesterase [Spartobacteria bacterium]|nr:acyl-CoA thioesterase [Spartobacteria bacterium]
MAEYLYRHDFKVRDYECDMQGIVNNAVYQHYLEHARHECLLHLGINFADLTRQNIHPVVTRVELDYKRPLTSGDAFWVGVNIEQTSRIRFAFLQDVVRTADNKLMLSGRTTGTAINEQGRPEMPQCIIDLLSKAT